MRHFPLIAAILASASPLAAQTADPAPPPRVQPPRQDSLLHQGATVQVRVPSLGASLLIGQVGHSNRSPGCLGIALEKRDTAGRQYFTYLKGVTLLQVDRRTNQGFHVRLDSPPGPEDWLTLTKAEVAVADSGCHRR